MQENVHNNTKHFIVAFCSFERNVMKSHVFALFLVTHWYWLGIASFFQVTFIYISAGVSFHNGFLLFDLHRSLYFSKFFYLWVVIKLWGIMPGEPVLCFWWFALVLDCQLWSDFFAFCIPKTCFNQKPCNSIRACFW